MIGSFLLEGHTAASEARLLVAPLLFVHLTAVHWWLGALYPLIAVTRRAEPANRRGDDRAVRRRAVLVVGAACSTAGRLLVLLLTGGAVRLDSRLPAKVADQARAGRGCSYALAAVEQAAPDPAAPAGLRARRARACAPPSRVEIAVALAHPCASAWLVATAPEG